MPDTADPVLLRDLSYQIMAAAFEVHNSLGPGFLEKVYENALIYELTSRKIIAEPQKEIRVSYKGQEVGSYVADILVENQIIS